MATLLFIEHFFVSTIDNIAHDLTIHFTDQNSFYWTHLHFAQLWQYYSRIYIVILAGSTDLFNTAKLHFGFYWSFFVWGTGLTTIGSIWTTFSTLKWHFTERFAILPWLCQQKSLILLTSRLNQLQLYNNPVFWAQKSGCGEDFCCQFNLYLPIGSTI